MTPHTRKLEPDDLPAVAALFFKVFRGGKVGPAGPVIAHMRDIYLDGPWSDPDVRSIVNVDAMGRVDGFFGIMAIPMVMDGKRVRACMTSTLMAENRGADPMVGFRLGRALIAGPQDLTVTDTANRISLDLGRHLRFATLTANSLEWYRVLRPAGQAAASLRTRGLGALVALLPARAIDRQWAKHRPIDADGTDTRLIDATEFAGHLIELSQGFKIRPEWTVETLARQLRIAAEKRGWGSLGFREVRAKANKLAGVFAVYADASRVATVLQAAVSPMLAERAVAGLCRDLAEQGCVAVRGQTSPRLMDGLFRTPGVFYRHQAATLLHSRHPAIVEAALSGGMLAGGLVGDTWVRLTSDDFS